METYTLDRHGPVYAYLPEELEDGKRYPLVIALNCTTGDPQGEVTGNGWDAVVREDDVIVVAPTYNDYATLSIMLLLAFMAVACAFAESDQEAENYTRYFAYTPVENVPIGLVPGENHNTLVLYFSRVGNTAFPEEVDAVSYASQNVTEGERLVGTAQMVAGWIADETGGDVFPIQTAYTYPEAFWDTVTVIEGQEKDRVHPRMAAIPEGLTGYDTVWLVTPIWAYSVCLPVRSFLESVDLSGKTVYVFTTHCGSGMSDAMEVVQALQPNADVRKGMTIASDTFDGIREQVLQFVQGIQD